MEVAGTDSTGAYEDVGHSEDAKEIMLPFMVASIEGADEDTSALEQSVRVYPQASTPTAEQAKASAVAARAKRWLHPTIELGVFALGTAAAAYFFARQGHKTVHELVNNVSTMTASKMHASANGRGGFVQGFVLASATASVVAVASVRYLSGFINSESTFGKYPSHISASQTFHAPHVRGSIHPTEYRKFTLTEKTELSKDIYRLQFALPTPTSVLGLPIGQHIAIRGPVGDETVFRSYTPISNNRDLGRLELLIRVYNDGKLTSGYLQKLQVGDKVDIRGPKGAMKYRRGMSKHLGMVGGGTGITPLYQLIRAICEDPTDTTTISLVYANRSEGDIQLRKQLEGFAQRNPEKFKLRFQLDHPSDSWEGGKGYITKEVLEERMPTPSEDTKILLCGPPGMVNATKKNLVELGFKEPGAVSKMTDQIFLF